MTVATLADGTDLDQWAERRYASGSMPRIIRRLISATTKTVTHLTFPADDAILLGGWDGVVTATEGDEFVPAGRSVWELGTNGSPKAKADADYSKRTADPLGLTKAETVFVFVTPRRWGGKDKWVKERQKENAWKDVMAYDADDLEHWLENAPAVHVWLSILIGKRSEGAIDISTFWNEWSGVTAPVISPQLLSGGREDITAQILNWLQGEASEIGLMADSQEEALAFFAAMLHSLELQRREPYLSRSLIVESGPAWRHISNSVRPLILVPKFEDREAAGAAAKAGHHVLIPLGRSDGTLANVIELPKLRLQKATEALISMAIPGERAIVLAALARRSIIALRRSLAKTPAVKSPQWASPANAASLFPAALVGTWHNSVLCDREIVGKIAGILYDQAVQTFARWENEPNPPIRRIGDTWVLTSKEDAWRLLAGFMTRGDIERFKSAATDVLSEIDPALDLPAKDRWAASTYGKQLTHSGLLREGIADTLALAATMNDTVHLGGRAAGQELADQIVGAALMPGKSDWRIWASLSLLLPLLSEAAPSVFLGVVEATLIENPGVLVELLSDSQTGEFGNNPHTGLLWALETLAWWPEYLSRTAMILAKLARLDPNPKSRHANRPHFSLHNLLRPTLPQTAANQERRMRVIDGMRRREPEVAWKLMRGLLPDRPGGVMWPAHRPRWRDWAPESSDSIALSELLQAAKDITDRMLEDAGSTASRLADLVSLLGRVPVPQRDAILARLAGLTVDSVEPEEMPVLRNSLRETISKHRGFADANWALPSAVVDQLETVYERLEPADTVARYAPLFNVTPSLTSVSRRDWQGWQQALTDARRVAIEAVYVQGSTEKILSLANMAECAQDVGLAFGMTQLGTDGEDSLLVQELGRNGTPRDGFIANFIRGRVLSRNMDWACSKAALAGGNWSAEQRAAFLLALPVERSTWDLVASTPEATQIEYWSSIWPRYIEDHSDLAYVVSKLIDRNRPFIAIDLIFNGMDSGIPSVPAETIAEVVEHAYQNGPEPGINMSMISHSLAALIDYLEKAEAVSEERLAAMEWAFLLLLEHERPPKILTRELARNPQFFVEVLSMIYVKEGEEVSDVPEEQKNRARLAYELLEKWRTMPGSQSDATLDCEALKDWVRQVREAADVAKLSKAADISIGNILAFSPPGGDGMWPAEGVRDLIEDLTNQTIERAVQAQVYNMRGVVTKAHGEGGEQERQLADTYYKYAQSVIDLWPRTGALLNRIADIYSTEATDENLSSELSEDLGH